MLLRIAIGWHICYEGLTKLDPSWKDLQGDLYGRSREVSKPFSSEMYLRNSAGPLKGFFRGMVPDYYGIDSAGPATLPREGDYQSTPEWDAAVQEWDAAAAAEMEARTKGHWNDVAGLYSSHYGFSDDQQQKLEQYLAGLERKLVGTTNAYGDLEPGKVNDPAWLAQLRDYRADRDRYAEWDAKGYVDPRENQLREGLWKQVASERAALAGPLDSWTAGLRDELDLMLTGEQIDMPDPMKPIPEMDPLERADFFTAWGLTVCGALMMVGLLSRLSSLGAAGFLALFYFSYPPWPGVPPAPNAEGTYLIVNKNLIEMIACLMLATSPSGVWGGLDALVRGLITRPLFGFGKTEVEERHYEDDY